MTKIKINKNYNLKLKLNKSDQKIIEAYRSERKIKESTAKGAYTSARHLLNYTGCHLQELLDIAKKEQEQNLNPYNLTIYKILKGLRDALIEKGMTPSAYHSYIAKAGVIFRHNNIYVPELPQIQSKELKAERYEITYEDLPDKDCIIKAIGYLPSFRPYILFSSSSGTARAECLSITVGMWLDGCKDYIEDTSKPVKNQIESMIDRKDVIPLIRLQRKKTYKTYYTCCSPEAAYYVNQRLLENKIFDEDQKIFPYSDSLVITRFQKINDHFGWGFCGKYRRFRTHMLRKFHASNLGCDPFIIDRLEGRSKNKLHETYIKTNPKELRHIYSMYMHNVMISPEYWDCPGLEYESNVKKEYEMDEMFNDSPVSFLEHSVPKKEEEVTPKVQQVNNTSTTQPVQQNSNMMWNVYIEIGKLQQRIDELEQEIQELKK